MTTTTTPRAGDTITDLTVIVERMTGFWRYNYHSRQEEYKYTISMSGVDADPDEPWYVTFVNSAGVFADGLKEGDRITIRSAKLKRFQEYNGDCQAVLTHCKK